MSEYTTSTKVLAESMHILANEVICDDGVVNAAIFEAAMRLKSQEAQIQELQELLDQSALPELAELLGQVIEMAVNMSQELQDIADAGEEAGCEMTSTKQLIEEWNTLYQAARVYE